MNCNEFINYSSVSSDDVEPSIPRCYHDKPNKRTFFKKFWILFLIVFFITLVLVGLCFFCDKSNHVTILNIVITFLATCLVAIFVFYYSWKNFIYSENKNVPYIELGYKFKLFNNNHFYFDDKEIFDFHSKMVNYTYPDGPDDYSNNYFDIRFKNLNSTLIKTFRPCFINCVKKNGEKFLYMQSKKLHYIAENLTGLIDKNVSKRVLLSIPDVMYKGEQNEIGCFIIGYCIIDEFDKTSFILSMLDNDGDFPGYKSIFVNEKLFSKTYKISGVNKFRKIYNVIRKF